MDSIPPFIFPDDDTPPKTPAPSEAPIPARPPLENRPAAPRPRPVAAPIPEPNRRPTAGAEEEASSPAKPVRPLITQPMARPIQRPNAPTPQTGAPGKPSGPVPPANRPSKPRPSAPRNENFAIWPSLQTFLGIALILATLFTVWTPENLFTNQWMDRMFQSWQTSGTVAAPLVATQPSNGQPRIGIVSGHSGNDSGAVCDPPLDKRFTEAQINSLIANKVVANLKSQGYQVDLLKEFDPRLTQYRALALVSIHTDSCKYINNEATGFKVAAAKNSVNTNLANRLSDCLWNRYQKDTGLKPHYGSVTTDMTDYHAFNEINSDTTAAIIEIGFMNLDYDTIMNNPDKIAQGITDGIICFARNEDVGNPAPTATPGQ